MDAAKQLPLRPIALVMAGGSGSRFWPLSQKNLPKQYLSLSGNKTLIEQTVDRIRPFSEESAIFISSSKDQESLLKEHVPTVRNLILEPVQKNTAACLMLSVAHLLKKGYPKKTPMMVFPADHVIKNQTHFEALITKALELCTLKSSLITLGIAPTSAHTGYGYIEADPHEASSGAFKVKQFREKPSPELAQQFIQNPRFFWNSGIFVWTLGSIVNAFEKYLEPYWTRILNCPNEQALTSLFLELPNLPIDKAVLEKAENVYVIPATDLGWSDLGSWSALYDYHSVSSTKNGNVFLRGQVQAIQSTGCLVHASSQTKVALIGLENIVVVEHNGTLLIAAKNQDQKVKDISLLFEA